MPDIGGTYFETVELDLTQDLGDGPEAVTYRFCRTDDTPPLGLSALPLLLSTTRLPAKLEVAKGLGVRGRVTCRFRDAINDGDVQGGDPPAETTFWKLLRARSPFFNGRPLRIIRGSLAGGTFTAESTLHYVIRKIEGPKKSGEFLIEAEDLTGALARGRAQCPAVGTAALLTALGTGDTAATLDDATAADDYPAAGYCRFGDAAEVCAFTRSGAALTLTRAQLGTAAEAHDAGAEVQPVAYLIGTIADVAYELLTDYAGIPPAQIDKTAWDATDAEWLQFDLERLVWEPTDVEELLADLLRTFPFVVGYNPNGPAWVFRGLEEAGLANDATLVTDHSEILAGTFEVTEDPDESWTRMLIYYGPKDWSEDLEKANNYSRAFPFLNRAIEAADQRGQAKLKTLFVPWLAADQGIDVRRIGTRLQKAGERDRRTLKWTSAKELGLEIGDFARVRTPDVISETSELPATSKVLIQSTEEINSGAQVKLQAVDLFYRGNYRRWAPDEIPTYNAQTDAQKARYLSLADDDDTLGTANDPAHDWL